MSVMDIAGKKFGRLIAVRPDESNPKKWICRCDCGNISSALKSDLTRGHTTSCGCYRRQRLDESITTHGCSSEKSPNHRMYRTWQDMKARCYNSRNKRYRNYGGRGIKVCKEWVNSFENFYEHVSKLEHFKEPGYTIDRINVNGDYEPGNIRWADSDTQASNKTTSHYVTDKDGEVLTIAQYAQKHGIGYNRAYYLNGGKERLYAKKKEKKCQN